MDVTYERLRTAAPHVFAAAPVVVAYLFGSRATGLARPDSDVDIAVLLRPEVDRNDYLDLGLRLARELATSTGLGDLDVVVLNDAPLVLRGRVVRDRKVLFSADESARVAYESGTTRVFFDFTLHSDRLDRELLARIADGRR